jgi:hypothetical protein
VTQFRPSVGGLIDYASNFGNLLWEDPNAFVFDISPLYIRKDEFARGVHQLLPEATLALSIRNPLARAVSSYRYFCLQEPIAACKPEIFEERIIECTLCSLDCTLTVAAVIRSREFVCERESLAQCALADSSDSVWPWDEPDIIAKYQWEIEGVVSLPGK